MPERARLSPKDAFPFVDLALTRLQQKSPGGAIAPAETAVQLAPNSAEAHYALGRVYLEMKRVDQAVAELETAARLAPASPEVHFSLARAYTKQNRPEKAEAERAIFARLNALAEQQRSGRGNQAYGASHEKDTLSSVQKQAVPSNQK